jgi:deoxyribodipyrimidine photo-lyase
VPTGDAAPCADGGAARAERTAALASLLDHCRSRLQPTIDWAAGLRAAWTPGEAGAATTLDHFLDTGIAHYAPQRDHPARAGTSRLSPHLHFGEIGPRQLWHAVHSRAAHDRQPGVMRGAERYLRELGWREFAHHLLVHFTHTPEASLRSRFDSFPWADDAAALRAWQKGRTGYPIVDAGMRELWETGWMHNRVRMIVASFLVKDLLLSWRSGAEWFWDTLVDADLANNTLGWQWTAGCGADAAPYFRIFNPVSQGQKFDPDGAYVRRWVPALAQLPPEWIHRPWEAPAPILAAAAVRLGDTYPPPIVDRRGARQRALSALASIKKPQPAAPLG